MMAALDQQRTGLAPCRFETVELDTHVGEVEGVDDERVPRRLAEFDCRNNRLAQQGFTQDEFAEAVEELAGRLGRRRSLSGCRTVDLRWKAAHRLRPCES